MFRFPPIVRFVTTLINESFEFLSILIFSNLYFQIEIIKITKNKSILFIVSMNIGYFPN